MVAGSLTAQSVERGLRGAARRGGFRRGCEGPRRPHTAWQRLAGGLRAPTLLHCLAHRLARAPGAAAPRTLRFQYRTPRSHNVLIVPEQPRYQ